MLEPGQLEPVRAQPELGRAQPELGRALELEPRGRALELEPRGRARRGQLLPLVEPQRLQGLAQE